ncbi:Gfo/Idh/MocA family oxidoreductase [Kiritimatiellaeota bacterium B1221]|nr:Gfo/Idh/MocA family oxidoreductase [Kiritimatiellaeota bacterium B1221]
MSEARDGMNWAPTAAKPEPVVAKGEFIFASAFFNHGHIYGQTNGLTEAGGVCKWAWDPDSDRLDAFCEKYPEVQRASSYEQILEDPEVQLITAAAIPSDRCEFGIQALRAGKDYFTDKSPFTSLAQLAEAKKAVEETGKKYMCDFSERLHTEAGWYAGELIREGAIGKVIQVMTLAPHNLAKESRPDWFFDKEKYGGILTDIGSHQFEQFLSYAGAKDATVNFARVDNIANADTPGLEDFGEASLTTDNGVSCYCRIDWFNPRGHRSWGDGRTFILGTDGYIEVRKYNDITREPKEDQVVYLVDHEGEKRIPCSGKIGFPFYGQFILDILNRTEKAMTQAHCFKAAELSMKAQKFADEANLSK